jgi:(1->4)-alpha-D-glucan 1-alpha-D-glucosylmutase
MALIDELIRKTLESLERRRALPESTYRVQFHKGFTFDDAAAIVPYLRDLGVTHVYASPYLKAVPGSTHGYDVIDHCSLNPELGGEAAYERLLAALARNGMSHILDTVPNHVGVATNDNTWWNDVLENGPASPFARYFDIAWRGSPRPELHDRVLLPVLGAPYGQVLENGELKLKFADGALTVWYYDRWFPINRRTYPEAFSRGNSDEIDRALAALNGTPGEARSFDALDDLLGRQCYRLAYWRVAPDEINYRRFFDINDLAALAQENEEVFDATHELILDRLCRGDIGGLRIDHPDGLYDPKQYFERLQSRHLLACARNVFEAGPAFRSEEWKSIEPALRERLERDLPAGGGGPRRWPLYVTVEKILAAGEPLPDDWPVHGTSGYDFLNRANALFVDRANEGAFTGIYQQFTGDSTSFEDLVYEKKLLILDRSLASELQMLAHRLARITARNRRWRDFTHSALKAALRQVIACFPVYRSYISDRGGVGARDRRDVETAVAAAIRRNPKTERSVLDALRDLLLQDYPDTATDEDRAEQRAFAGKFQQLTAPTTAKGIEDTAFYIYNRLVALNEVGGDPDRFGAPPEELHAYLADRQAKWPYALSALSTHDTKRSEDVRARLNALSEMPEQWEQNVTRWREINARLRGDIDPNDEYLIYQTLVGAWPLEPYGPDEYAAFVTRVQAYMTKAMREAKVRTSWTDQDEGYESAVTGFVASILDAQRSKEFLEAFRPFQRRRSRLGLFNSLSQTLLRLTAPGVPDTYQGGELWDFSLVDPDNRRPVDYSRRRDMLQTLQREFAADPLRLMRRLIANPEDGAIKLHVTWRALQARREFPGLFSQGEYCPLEITGEKRRHLFAFARRLGTQSAVVLIPRLIAHLAPTEGELSLANIGWADTSVSIEPGPRWKDAFTGQTVERVDVRNSLSHVPVALLVSA